MTEAWTDCFQRNLAAVRVTTVPPTADVELLGRLSFDDASVELLPTRLRELVLLLATTSTAVQFAADSANSRRFTIEHVGRLVDVLCSYTQIAAEMMDPRLGRSEFDDTVSERLKLLSQH